LRDLLPM